MYVKKKKKGFRFLLGPSLSSFAQPFPDHNHVYYFFETTPSPAPNSKPMCIAVYRLCSGGRWRGWGGGKQLACSSSVDSRQAGVRAWGSSSARGRARVCAQSELTEGHLPGCSRNMRDLNETVLLSIFPSLAFRRVKTCGDETKTPNFID